MRARAALAVLLAAACAAPCAATFAVEKAGVRVSLLALSRPLVSLLSSLSASSHLCPRQHRTHTQHQVVYPTSSKGNRYVESIVDGARARVKRERERVLLCPLAIAAADASRRRRRFRR